MNDSKPKISTGNREVKGILSKDKKTKFDIKIKDKEATFDGTKLDKGTSKAKVKADIKKYSSTGDDK